jgi:2-amino-4-hydroxy-6-hydroxymethyldihydropteridine diphosphokinase
MTETVLISLGSNLDRSQAFIEAQASLSQHFPDIQFSSLVEGPAIGFEGEDFYNAVAQFTTDLGLDALLEQLKSIEKKLCQGSTEHSLQNRRMDIDLLAYGQLLSEKPDLPRGDILRFAFVACPLAELAPHWIHPKTHASIQSICAALDSSRLKKVTLHA